MMATETVQEYEGGQVVATYTIDIPDAEANRRDLQTLARQALTGNRAFLALASPTNAQTLAQVKALTRQMNALIRLEVGQLDGTD